MWLRIKTIANDLILIFCDVETMRWSDCSHVCNHSSRCKSLIQEGVQTDQVRFPDMFGDYLFKPIIPL